MIINQSNQQMSLPDLVKQETPLNYQSTQLVWTLHKL